MIGYAVGNAAGPQYWKAQYQPRNRVPWIILAACWAASALLLLATRWWLARENARREREGPDGRYDDVYVSETLADGSVVEKKVDKVRACCHFSTRLLVRGADVCFGDRRSWTSPTSRTATSATCSERVRVRLSTTPSTTPLAFQPPCHLPHRPVWPLHSGPQA